MAQRDIGTLRTRLSFENDDVNKSLEGFRRDLKGLRSEMNLARSKGREYTQSLKGMREQSDILSRRLKTQQERVKELKKRYDESVKAKGEDANQTRDLAAQYNNATAEMNRTEQQLQRLNEEIRRQESPWTQLGDRMTSAGDKMQEFGRMATDFGKSYTMRVTTPIVAGATAVFKASMDYESAFAGVRKTVDATEEEFAELSAGIREMTKVLPASATEIAGVAENAGQLGIANEHILSFTRTMIDMGEATNLSAEQAATEFARFANIVGMSQKDFDRLGSVVVDLGNNLATTEREIVEMGLRLAGAGAQIGLTEAQIMAFAGSLSSVGIAAEAGGSAFSKVMVEMQLAAELGGEKLQAFADVAGMSASDFKKAFEQDAAGAIIAFIDGLSTAEERGVSAIKVLDDMGIREVRMRDALLRAAGATDVFTDSLEMGTRAWEENVALTEEAEQRYGTSESKIKILWNRLKDVAITLGDALVPAVIDALDAAEPWIRKIEDGAKAFSEMDEEQQRTIMKIIAFTAAVGPASVGIGQLSLGISGLLKAGGGLASMLGRAGGSGLLGRLAMMGPGALTPVGLAIAGIGILGATVYQAHQRKKELRQVNLEVVESMHEEAQVLGDTSSRYEELFEKNKLSNDEKARFIDLSEEMKNTTDEEKLKALHDEYEKLREKSGLTNDEMEEFVGLNSELSEKVDESNQKITEQGNVFIDNLEALREMNEEQRERIRLELEAQKAAAEAGLEEALRERRKLLQDIKELEEEIPITQERILEQEERVKQAKEETANAIESGNVIQIARQLEIQANEEATLQKLRDQLSTQRDQLVEKHNELDATEEQIKALDKVYQAMIDIELSQVGIVAEKGKGLEAIDKEIQKLEEQKKQLDEKKKKQEISTEEYNNGIKSIDGQISNLKTARSRVEDITKEAKEANKELEKRIDKQVDVDDGDTVQKINKEASKSVTKAVTLRAVWQGVKQGFRMAFNLPASFAKGTNYAPSGLAWLGEEGTELVRRGNKWALADFGLYNLRGGEQVFTHEQTKSILRALNRIPGYATGTNMGAETNRIVGQLNRQSDSFELVEILQEQNEHLKRSNELLTALLGKDLDLYKLNRKVDEGLNDLGNRRNAAWGGA